MRGLSSCFSSMFDVRHHRRRIEHAETDARGEQPDERRVDGALGQIALLHGFDVRPVVVVVVDLVEVDTFIVHAALERDGRGLRLRRAIVVAVEDVAHGAAVGDHVALETATRRAECVAAGTRWRRQARR